MDIVTLNKMGHKNWDVATLYKNYNAKVVFSMEGNAMKNLEFKSHFEDLLTEVVGLTLEDFYIPESRHDVFEVYLVGSDPIMTIRMNDEYVSIVDRITKLEIHNEEFPVE